VGVAVKRTCQATRYGLADSGLTLAGLQQYSALRGLGFFPMISSNTCVLYVFSALEKMYRLGCHDSRQWQTRWIWNSIRTFSFLT